MLVSIITPTFNAETYIARTIESIQAQSYKKFEHIIVDGASTDRTIDIVRSYPNVTYICERDSGQSDALNKGFRIAKGDILAWQNADDIYSDNAFEIVVRYFTANPTVDIVYGKYHLIDEYGNWICTVSPPKWNKWLFMHGRFVPLQPTVFWRRKVYEGVGELDVSLHYCMDVDFFCRACKRYSFAKIPAVLGSFRVHRESKTQNSANRKKVVSEYKSVLMKHFQYSYFDSIVFEIFQKRKRLASFMRRNLIKGT